jgi:hypothetical protein
MLMGRYYVFLPQYAKRDYALKQLQRQLDILMWHSKLGKDIPSEMSKPALTEIREEIGEAIREWEQEQGG